jgi:spermidine synthase
MRPLRTVDSRETADGTLALLQRGERDFLITIAGRVLMTSTASRSEVVLGTAACRHLGHGAPRVLVGGLGMGVTLRAVLDQLPASAEVTVAELNPIVAAWCRGPLAGLTACAVDDPRVTVSIGDVADAIAGAPPGRFDAIVLDLYVGPGATTRDDDALYGRRAIADAARALAPGAILGVWGEAFDAAYARRLGAAGLDVKTERPGRGGLRHVVYLAQKRGAATRS